MDIYVGHPSSINYREKLYKPLRNSKLNDKHDIVLPHEGSEELFDSKTYLREECDLMIADVTEASTGLGIELGWADMYDVPVICIHQEESNPSSSLKAVTDTIASYQGKEDLIENLDTMIGKINQV